MNDYFFSRLRNTFSLILIFGVIFLQGCKKDDSSPGKNQVNIVDMSFNPSSITVNVNSTVTWTNKDAVAHTVTSDDGLFDSGSIAKNGTYSYKFATAGTFPYHCSIHPEMTAKVVVQQQSSSSSSGSGY